MPGPTFVLGSLTYIADLNTLSNAILTMDKKGVNFTAVRGYWYVLTANALQVTLPLAPAAGDLIRLSPSVSTVLSVTLLRNGQPIDSTASDVTINGGVDRDLNLWLLYVDGSVGWRVIRAGVAAGLPYGGVKTTNFSAVRNTQYVVDANSLTVTLPASPATGEMVQLRMASSVRFGTVLSRNGSNIAGAAADLTIAAGGQDVTLLYADSTIGWLPIFAVSTSPAPHFDLAVAELKYHNTQRDLSDTVGWCPHALCLTAAGSDAYGTAQNEAANGGTIVAWMFVPAHMLVHSFTYRSSDATLDRSCEFRLYKQRLNNGNGSENTLDEWPGINGTDAQSPATAASNRTVALGAPVYLPPGVYLMALRNTHATNTLGVGTLASVGTLAQNTSQTKTLGSALGSTLDMVAATWTKQVNIPGFKLNGRVFGQTAAW